MAAVASAPALSLLLGSEYESKLGLPAQQAEVGTLAIPRAPSPWRLREPRQRLMALGRHPWAEHQEANAPGTLVHVQSHFRCVLCFYLPAADTPLLMGDSLSL